MFFNSIDFAIFFPLIFILYWFVFNKNLKIQNVLLLVSSYVFYGWWDWRFLFLLVFSTSLDYFTGIKMYEAKDQTWRKFWLWLSIGINLGFLGFFKYYNFFIENFTVALESLGISINTWTLKIILPVGISFYTFHGLSYVIDIYYNRIKPERNIISYSVFVSFFPLLVAGPIERATHLLPQIIKVRTFDYHKAVNGLRQILWGLFKKVVIADTCAIYVNDIYSNYHLHNGVTLAMGAVLFAIQVYGDFSGYSDIALGTARLFGIELLRNFAFPYFSRDIAEFWRRWHISLSSWFRDYIFIPLGGSRVSKWKQVRNIIIVFTISGIWHGADWTYISFGFLNGVLFIPLMLSKKNKRYTEIVAQGKLIPSLREAYQIISTFTIFCIILIIFRSESMQNAFSFIARLFTEFHTLKPDMKLMNVFIITILLMVIEWIYREKQFSLEDFQLSIRSRWLRWGIYFILACFIFANSGNKQEFVYFQF